MPDDDKKLPAWSVTLKSGAKVTLISDEEAERNMFFFERDGHETKIVLSDGALAAVVSLAITRGGVPVLVDTEWKADA
jgi:hypothetical protein